MGRGPFFGGARKMRGFPMNLSPGGLDEAGFPYFGHDGKFEFGYGGPPFHSHGDAPFFPGHPIGPMPFNGSGKHTVLELAVELQLGLPLQLRKRSFNF